MRRIHGLRAGVILAYNDNSRLDSVEARVRGFD